MVCAAAATKERAPVARGGPALYKSCAMPYNERLIVVLTHNNQRNIATKRAIKASTKAFAAEPSAAALSQAQSELDKAVKKGLLKKNTASRRKASLAKAAKAAGVKLA